MTSCQLCDIDVTLTWHCAITCDINCHSVSITPTLRHCDINMTPCDMLPSYVTTLDINVTVCNINTAFCHCIDTMRHLIWHLTIWQAPLNRRTLRRYINKFLTLTLMWHLVTLMWRQYVTLTWQRLTLLWHHVTLMRQSATDETNHSLERSSHTQTNKRSTSH